MSGLKVLSLQETNLTAEGIRQLASMKGLEKLHIGGIDIPREAVEELQRQLPDCQVSFWERPALLPE